MHITQHVTRLSDAFMWTFMCPICLHPTYNRASQETQEIILDYPCAQLAMQNSTQRYTDGRRKVRSITRAAQLGKPPRYIFCASIER